MNNARARKRKVVEIRDKTPLAEVKDKGGRVDCLLFGAFNLLAPKLEERISLPGLSAALAPIVEDEIKKYVRPEKVVEDKYMGLLQLVGGLLNAGSK